MIVEADTRVLRSVAAGLERRRQDVEMTLHGATAAARDAAEETGGHLLLGSRAHQAAASLAGVAVEVAAAGGAVLAAQSRVVAALESVCALLESIERSGAAVAVVPSG